MSKNLFDNMKESAFYHFGILPQWCIHSIDEDEYSKMYVPEKVCGKCGHDEFKESTMIVIDGYPEKGVHRCIKCNEVRLAQHIGIKEEEGRRG